MRRRADIKKKKMVSLIGSIVFLLLIIGCSQSVTTLPLNIEYSQNNGQMKNDKPEKPLGSKDTEMKVSTHISPEKELHIVFIH